jgi:hypothetical protein
VSSRPVPSRLHRPRTRRDARAAGITDWQVRHGDLARLSGDTYLPLRDAGDPRTRLPAEEVVAAARLALAGWEPGRATGTD